MDSCQKVDTDPSLMNSAEKGALCTLLFTLLWSITKLAECCAHRNISTLGLKRITLRLNAMTRSCYLQNRSGKKKKIKVA